MSNVRNFMMLLTLWLVLCLLGFIDGQTGDTGYDYDLSYGDNGADTGELPQFDIRETIVKAAEGENVELPCSVKNLRNYEVSWLSPSDVTLTIGMIRLVDDNQLRIARPFGTDWSLHIMNVNSQYRGRYTCSINTSPATQTYVNLVVEGPPKILSPIISRIGYTLGSVHAFMECSVEAIPKAVVTWMKEDAFIKANNSHYELNTYSKGNGKTTYGLTIRNMRQEDYGTYYCQAYNAYGMSFQEVDLYQNRTEPYWTKRNDDSLLASSSPGEMFDKLCFVLTLSIVINLILY